VLVFDLVGLSLKWKIPDMTNLGTPNNHTPILLQFPILPATSSCCVGISMPQILGYRTGGAALEKNTLRAPASRAI
jgi:hypothetical protein